MTATTSTYLTSSSKDVRAHVTVTTRDGGVSAPPYATNNLALHVDDDGRAVVENRRRLAASLGVERVQFMHQVHGADVAVVDEPSADVDGVDALVTTRPGVAIAALAADCVPIVIAGDHAVAVVHAGRNGVVRGVVDAAVRAVRSADDGELTAVVGPAICGRCYEVPATMQDDVCAVSPQARATTRQGTPGLDLPAAVRAQLAAAGVDVANDAAPCTFEDTDYYSHRRDGVTGRMAIVAILAG